MRFPLCFVGFIHTNRKPHWRSNTLQYMAGHLMMFKPSNWLVNNTFKSLFMPQYWFKLCCHQFGFVTIAHFCGLKICLLKYCPQFSSPISLDWGTSTIGLDASVIIQQWWVKFLFTLCMCFPLFFVGFIHANKKGQAFRFRGKAQFHWSLVFQPDWTFHVVQTF